MAWRGVGENGMDGDRGERLGIGRERKKEERDYMKHIF